MDYYQARAVAQIIKPGHKFVLPEGIPMYNVPPGTKCTFIRDTKGTETGWWIVQPEGWEAKISVYYREVENL